MREVFILQNQDKLFLGKQHIWVDGRDLNNLFKSTHKDEAINQMFEASSKDYKQRIKIVCCQVNDKGMPIIDPLIMPPPQAKPGKGILDEATESAKQPSVAEDIGLPIS